MHERNPILELARACMEKSSGDPKGAAKLMRQKIDRNARLRDALLEPLVDAAIWQAIRRVLRATRQRCAGIPTDPGINGIRGVAEYVERCLLDFPLASGMQLRHATRKELAESVANYEGLAAGNAFQARWLGRILALLPDDQTRVEDVVSEEEAQRIREESV